MYKPERKLLRSRKNLQIFVIQAKPYHIIIAKECQKKLKQRFMSVLYYNLSFINLNSLLIVITLFSEFLMKIYKKQFLQLVFYKKVAQVHKKFTFDRIFTSNLYYIKHKILSTSQLLRFYLYLRFHFFSLTFSLFCTNNYL